MKRMKIISFVILTILAALCGSCRTRPGPYHDQVDELVRCLNERDEEGIKNLLCESVRASEMGSLGQQISDVFDLFADRTISSYDWSTGVSQLSWEKGKKTWEKTSVIIEEIELSDGSDEIEYIVFSTTLVNEENPRRVGLSWFYVFYDDNEYWVGEEVD